MEKAFRDPAVCVYVVYYAMPTYVGLNKFCVYARSSTVGFGKTAMSARRASRVDAKTAV